MKKTVLIWLGFIGFMYGNILSDTLDKIKNDSKEFRVYPRIQKAKTLIARNSDKEAEVLLKKVLEIDASQKEAANMLVTLCMKHNEVECVEQYASLLSEHSRAMYYLASIHFQNRHYLKAQKYLSSIKDLSKLSQKERLKLMMTDAKLALLLDKKDLSQKLEKIKQKKTVVCSREYQEIISLLMEHKQISYAADEVGFVLLHCQPLPISAEKRVVWVEILRDKGEYEAAKKLIKTLSSRKKRLEEEYLLALAQKKYSYAIKALEKLFALQPDEQHRKQLAYLYEKTSNKPKLAALYQQAYEKTKEAKWLRKLLYLYDKTPLSWLKSYYPYEGLSKKERYVFLTKYLHQAEQKGKKKTIETILNQIAQLKGLDDKEQEILSFHFTERGQKTKAVKILEKMYQNAPTEQNRKKLLYLYGKEKKYQSKKEALIRSSLHSGCRGDEVRMLLALKSQRSVTERLLEQRLPFECLSTQEQRNALSGWLSSHLSKYHKQTNPKWVFDLLKKYKKIPPKTHLALAKQLRDYHYYQLSSKFAKYALSYNKKESYQLMAKNAYSMHHYHEALKYYKNIHKIDPADADVMRNIGETALHAGDKKTALKYFDLSLQKRPDQKLLLQTAYLAEALKKDTLAQKLLNRMHPPVGKMAVRYYLLQGRLSDKRGEDDASAVCYHKVLHFEKFNQTALYRLAVLAEKKGQYKKSIHYLKTLLPYTKDKEKYYVQIGYWAQKYHDDKEAMNAFEKALECKKDPQYYKAYGYSAANLHKREIAVKSLKRALDLGQSTMSYTEKYELKQSIKYIEDNFNGYFALVSSSKNSINTLHTVNSESIGGYATLRLSYAPQKYNKQVTYYLNNSVALKSKSLHTVENSYQPSIGVSYQPSKKVAVIMSVEALLKAGSESRGDVMARLSGKFFDDYRFQPEKSDYPYKSLYMDIAYFFSASSYRFYGRYEQGHIYKLGSLGALMPYAGLIAALDNDNSSKRVLYEYDLALGLSYIFWLNESRYRSHETTGRVSFEGKIPIKSNLNEDTQVQMIMEMLF